MDIDRNRDANQGRKSVILSFPFFIATMSNIFVPLLKGWGEVLKTSGMCQVPRQAEILLKEEHNRLGDGFSPILGSALRPLVLRSVSKKLSSQLFCSSRLSILHSEYFYADHPILNWSYNKYWKKYNLCPSNSASSGRHRLLRHSSIKHLLRMWYAPGKGKLSEVKIKTTAFALKEFTQSSHQFSSVQLLSRVWLFATPWTAALQTSLSISNSWSLFKLMSIESVDAIQPSHPLLSPSPPAFNLSQHQGLFKWVSSLHQVAKVLEFQLQRQSFQWIFSADFF